MRDWSSGLADVAGPSEKESVKTNLEASSLFVTGSQVAAFRSSCLELLRGGNGDAPLPENIGALHIQSKLSAAGTPVHQYVIQRMQS